MVRKGFPLDPPCSVTEGFTIVNVIRGLFYDLYIVFVTNNDVGIYGVYRGHCRIGSPCFPTSTYSTVSNLNTEVEMK